MKMSLLLTAVVLVLTAQPASAQDANTGSLITETGGTVRTTREVTDTIRALIPGRDPQELDDVLVSPQRQKEWENESAAARNRQAQHRRDCREAIRRANRDQLMDRVLSCYRSDLLQDVNILRKQTQHFNAVPLLDPVIHAEATGSILDLIDANMAIIDAMDTGVFDGESDVREARRNLRANYREPAWLAFTRLRADWELTYIAFIVKNLEERLAAAEPDGGIPAALHDAALCLESGTQMLLQSRTATDRLAAAGLLFNARAHLATCREMLEELE